MCDLQPQARPLPRPLPSSAAAAAMSSFADAPSDYAIDPMMPDGAPDEMMMGVASKKKVGARRRGCRCCAPLLLSLPRRPAATHTSHILPIHHPFLSAGSVAEQSDHTCVGEAGERMSDSDSPRCSAAAAGSCSGGSGRDLNCPLALECSLVHFAHSCCRLHSTRSRASSS